MISKPTIIIGIGSSGLNIIEQLQNFSYEHIGRNKPQWVEYLYIETNKDNIPKHTALPNEIRRVYISLAEMDTMIRDMKKKVNVTTSWLPMEDHVISAGVGASGIPSYGRLALWGRNNERDNLKNVIHAIQHAYSEISKLSVAGNDNSQPTVFVTGSLSGGTGAGLFMDLAYLIQHIIPDIKELFALFLLPPKPIAFQGKEIIYANTLGALKAIQYFNCPDVTFHIRLPNEFQLRYRRPPFELAQFVSQSYNSTLPDIPSLMSLYRIAGFYLFLNIIGLRGKRVERIVDARGNWQIGKHGTFGISAIQYPKSQIREYVSLELGSELLKKWIDKENYFKGGQITPINQAIITNRIKEVFTSILNDTLALLNTTGDKNIIDELKKEAALINKGDHSGTKEHYINNLFSSCQKGNWYDTVRNNITLAQNYMIRSLSIFIIQELNRYENLQYIRTELESFVDAMQECIILWKRLGVSSQSVQWEELLGNKQVPWMLKKRFVFDSLLENRMRDTLDLMKFHLFGKTLNDIKNNIKSGEIPLVAVEQEKRYDLPIVSSIDSMIRGMNIILGVEEDWRFMNIERRKIDIITNIDDTTIPILKIFPSGNFELEVKQSIKRYQMLTGQIIPSKDIIVGNEDLWNYLELSGNILKNNILQDIVQKCREKIDQIGCIEDYDITNYVRLNPNDAVKIAARSNFFLLPIRHKTLENSHNTPRCVISSEKEAIRNVITILREENFQEFEESVNHMLEIKELKNIIVFYIERGNFEPIEDITYMEIVKQLNEEYPKRYGGQIEENWDLFRNPYLNQGNGRPKKEKN